MSREVWYFDPRLGDEDSGHGRKVRSRSHETALILECRVGDLAWQDNGSLHQAASQCFFKKTTDRSQDRKEHSAVPSCHICPQNKLGWSNERSQATQDGV